jgi:hypothetical protein
MRLLIFYYVESASNKVKEIPSEILTVLRKKQNIICYPGIPATVSYGFTIKEYGYSCYYRDEYFYLHALYKRSLMFNPADGRGIRVI